MWWPHLIACLPKLKCSLVEDVWIRAVCVQGHNMNITDCVCFHIRTCGFTGGTSISTFAASGTILTTSMCASILGRACGFSQVVATSSSSAHASVRMFPSWLKVGHQILFGGFPSLSLKESSSARFSWTVPSHIYRHHHQKHFPPDYPV